MGSFVCVSVSVAVLALLSGCSGGPGIGGPNSTGKPQGGTVAYGEGGMSSATNTMNAHCDQSGKKAQITQMKPGAQGGVLEYECRGRKI